MSFKRIHLLALVIAMAVLVAACGGNADQGSTNNAASSAEPVEIKVALDDFNIVPDKIELTKGQPTKLVVTNNGPTEHDIVIAGLGVNVKTKSLKAGESETLSFTPNQSGTIETYCSIPGHKALGMVGEVVVQ